jgi:hypothetical protein
MRHSRINVAFVELGAMFDIMAATPISLEPTIRHQPTKKIHFSLILLKTKNKAFFLYYVITNIL